MRSNIAVVPQSEAMPSEPRDASKPARAPAARKPCARPPDESRLRPLRPQGPLRPPFGLPLHVAKALYSVKRHPWCPYCEDDNPTQRHGDRKEPQTQPTAVRRRAMTVSLRACEEIQCTNPVRPVCNRTVRCVTYYMCKKAGPVTNRTYRMGLRQFLHRLRDLHDKERIY